MVKRCYYCRKAAVHRRLYCKACEEKLKVVRRLMAVGAEIRMQAAKESAGRNVNHDH